VKRFLKALLLTVAVLVLVLAVAGFVVRDRIEIPAGFPGTYADVSGARIRYVQKGTGADLLLVHGSPGSLEDWGPLIDRLAERYRVTAYDRPCNGWSSSTAACSIAENARVAFGLIDALKLDRPAVIGHSYGGAVALRMAVEGDPRVRATVVVSSTAYPADFKPSMLGRLIRIPVLGRGVAWALAPVAGGMVEHGMRRAFQPNQDTIPPGFIELQKQVILQPKVLEAQVEEVALHDAEVGEMVPRYPQIRGPVLLVWGLADKPQTVASMERLASAVPGARTVRLENTGHMVQFARTAELLAAIDGAVTELK